MSNDLKFKHEKLEDVRTKIKDIFSSFLGNVFQTLPRILQTDNATELINKLKDDYDNFLREDYILKFNYPFEKFKSKKGLKDNNYKKLLDLDNEEFTDEDKIYFILASELKKIFSDSNSDLNKKQENQVLTTKQIFCYNYFIDSQPRCCFCGQILEISKNEEQEFIYADIEHIFPKSKFPQFILHPDNFAPVCKECNLGEKKDLFFKDIKDFDKALSELSINKPIHPLKLWQNMSLVDSNGLEIKIKPSPKSCGYKLLEFYGIPKRGKIILNRCYDILFNIIKHSNISSAESLERLIETLAASNWNEINDGYSLNNSPQIWQEFLECILFSETNLLALWEEIKDYSIQYSNFSNN